MVDYSKWDRLELSDDSDIEVHPNVDKRSFIRAKQRMIHEERQKRKIQIEDIKAQSIINDELLRRITTLIEALEKRAENVDSAEEQVFKTMMEITVNSQADDKAPALTHYQNPKIKDPQPTYTQMMASLVDQVKKEVDESNEEDRWKAFLASFKSHHAKLAKLQADAATEQAKLEKEEASKITSESIHDGFNSGYVNKSSSTADKKKVGSKVAAVEQINPNAKTQRELTGDLVSSGAEADVEEEGDESEADGSIKPTAVGYEFAKIKVGDYRKCLEFMTQNPNVVAEKEENGLLIEAFNSQIAGKDEYAHQCVHQALLLQYCRQLGRDGVGLFFNRITTKGHQAQQVFQKDVKETYEKLRNRARELAEERAKNPEGAGVETIQLQAVDPGTSINIQVPPPNHEDPAVQNARQIFESFPPGLQRALESGNLDEVNKVLGKMSVEEAEEVVEKLGEGGMLSLEQGIIDGTTEEGRAKIEELGKAAAARKAAEESGEMQDIYEIDEDDNGDLPIEGYQVEPVVEGKGKGPEH